MSGSKISSEAYSSASSMVSKRSASALGGLTSRIS